MKLREIEKAEKRAAELLAGKDAELAGVKSAINRLESEKVTKQEAAEEAAAAGRFEECEKLKAEITKMNERRDMYERREKSLEEDPLITEDEYKELCQAIKSESAEDLEAAIKIIVECSEQMQKTALELEEVQARANGILKKLCNKVLRDYKPYYDYIHKKYTKMFTKYESVDYGNVISWGRRGVKSQAYEDYTGKKAEPPKYESKNPFYL